MNQAPMKTVDIKSGLRGLLSLRHLRREQGPLLFTRHGAPDAIMLPLNERLEGRVLTQSDAFLRDIDSAEEQISRGTMIPLDQAIEQLGFGDSEPEQSTIDVDAPLEDVMTRWFAKGTNLEFTGSYMAGRLIAAEAFDRDGSLLSLKAVMIPPTETDAAGSLARTGVIISLHSTGKRRTHISVSVPAAEGVNPLDYTRVVGDALGAIKSDLERSGAGSRRRGPLSILARSR